MLENLMGFVGAIMVPIPTSFPMMIHIFVHWEKRDLGLGNGLLVFHSIIAIIGVLLSIVGVGVTITEILQNNLKS